MHPTAFRPTPRLVLASIGLLLAMSGCATVAEGQKIVVDGDKVVTREAAVGSHMRQRVKISELNQPGMSPTMREKVTDQTDTHVPPPLSGEMERMITDRATGN